MIETVLSVDIGTTSLKAGLITADGEVVFIFRKKYHNSQSKYVANQWVGVLNAAYEKAVAFCEKHDVHINAVGISGNGPTIVDNNGLTLLWNGYNIPKEQSKNLNEETQKSLLKVPSLFLPRILLFKQLYEAEFNQAETIFSGPEFLIYKLTGQKVTILPESRYENAYWNDELLQNFGLDSAKFPDFVNTAAYCGTWNNLPVYAGGPDFIVALIGTNTLEAGKICDRSGSSEGLNFCVEKQIFEQGVRTLPSVIPGLWNCSVLIPESSKLSNSIRTRKIKNAMQLLRKTAMKYHLSFPTEMKVTGGQTKDKVWMKEKSTFLGMTLLVCSCSDSELLGDASVAWYGLGKYESLQNAAQNVVKIECEYKPLSGVKNESL